MENENSKIPQYIFSRSKTNCILKDTQMKPLKEADLNFAASVPVPFASKDTNQRLPKSSKNVPQPPKKTATTVHSPTNRYRREADLRNKNKLLESVKYELNTKLSAVQKEIKEMKEQYSSLEKENQALKRFQESCVLILETRNCDSVAEENILEKEEKYKETQKEIMDLSEKLNSDLELFIQMTNEQKEIFRNTQMKWKQIEEEEAHFLEQQQHFNKEMEDLFASLDKDDQFLN
ncbi:small kinetochore-associated protein [Anolis sagrei]|uniref:small kinetochore-associated protein n=1 Tax=Anolis sagrei TaxID=38937 RepID=UPI003520DC0B